MPRGLNGVYQLPSGALAVAGTTILSGKYNEVLNDFGAEVTASLPRDGAAPMTGPITLPAGGTGNNALRFSGSPSSGFWFDPARNAIVFVVNGTEVLALSAAQSVGRAQLADLVRPAIGGITAFAGTTPPAGWLLCFGQAISRTTYADLFAAIGTAFGNGDGATTFNVPDLRGRTIIGRDDMGGTAASRITSAVSGINGTTLGAAGGDQRMQQHTHTASGTTNTAGAHTHSINAPGGSSSPIGGGTSSGVQVISTSSAGDHSHTLNITVADAGAGSSQNVQPSLVLNHMIYAGV